MIFISQKNGVKVEWQSDEQKSKITNPLFFSDMAEKLGLPDQRVENPDGSSITLDQDILGNPRNLTNPVVGPLENKEEKNMIVRVIGAD